MNIIKTIGDLKKALSVYPDDLKMVIHDGSFLFVLNNDTQIMRRDYPENLQTESIVEIDLIRRV